MTWVEAEGLRADHHAAGEQIVRGLVAAIEGSPFALAQAAWREAVYRVHELPLRSAEFRAQYARDNGLAE